MVEAALCAVGQTMAALCEYMHILGVLAKIHSGTQEVSKRTRGDSTYVTGH
jgi:hypothetical protein